jgi:hypothetical protein
MTQSNNVNIVLSLLINFIRNEIKKDEVLIDKNTSLKELGLVGHKGIMFMKKFGAEFKVNINTLNFEYHFTENSSNKATQPLTVNHLEQAIIYGQFDKLS